MHISVLGTSMKAHFKRSMKEYEAKYLKDNKQEKLNKPSRGSDDTSKIKTDMPKPTYSQETQHNLTSSVASASLMNSSKKDFKTTRKTSHPIHHKLLSHRHYTERQAPENNFGSPASTITSDFSFPLKIENVLCLLLDPESQYSVLSASIWIWIT